MKLNESIEQWIADVCAGKSNETPAAYRCKLRYLQRRLGHDAEMAGFTVEDFRNFIHALQNQREKRWGSQTIAAPLSQATIHTVATTVKAYLRWAYEHGHINEDPTVGVKIPPLPHPTPKAVSSDDVLKMLQAAATTGPEWERYRNVALIYTLRDTGGRVGGLVNMEVSDIDFERLKIRVVEKGNKPRLLYLVSATAEALRWWLEARKVLEPRDNRVFTSAKTRCGLSRGGIYSILRRLAHLGGVTGRFNPHAFRHAFARDALANGADISRLAKAMGHSNPYVTLNYYALWYDQEIREFHQQFSPVNHMPVIRPADSETEKPRRSAKP